MIELTEYETKEPVLVAWYNIAVVQPLAGKTRLFFVGETPTIYVTEDLETIRARIRLDRRGGAL